MEKNADLIGRKEFDDVWARVTGDGMASRGAQTCGETKAFEIGTVSGAQATKTQENETASRPIANLAATRKSLGGLVSNVFNKKSADVDDAPPAALGASAARSRASQLVAQTEAERLSEIIEATAQTARESATLASQCGGDIRAACLSMEKLCIATISSLNTQYQILTGLRLNPGSVTAQAASASERLSAIIGIESAVREVCAEALGETAIASLQSAYTRAAGYADRIVHAAEQLLWGLTGTQ